MMLAADSDGNGQIEFDEFSAVLKLSREDSTPYEAKAGYAAKETDTSGRS